MEIINSTLADLDAIFSVYELGIRFQQSLFHRHWLRFDRALLVKEIEESRHWKILVNDQIACVFSVQFEDSLVWENDRPGESLFLHRIVKHPNFPGNHFVREIVAWSVANAKIMGKSYVRLDTFPDNHKLSEYYILCGFQFCGIKEFSPTDSVPEHYRDGLGLYEIKIA